MSAERNTNLDQLKETIYSRLNFVRVYLKPRNEPPDFDMPMIVTAGATIADICAKLRGRIGPKPKYALVSGASVRFNSQRVGIDHIVQDQDVVTIVA